MPGPYVRTAVLAGVLSCPCHFAAAADMSCTLDRAVGTTIERDPFLTGGYSLRWSAVADRLAFMQPDDAGYYGVERRPMKLVAGTAAMSPAGSYFLGDLKGSLIKQTGLVRKVQFVCR